VGRTPFKHCLRGLQVKERLGLLFLVAVALINLVSCSNTKELTRDKAKKMLESSERFTPKQVELVIASDTVNCGRQLGLWYNTGPWGNLLIGPKGTQDIQTILADGRGGGRFTLKKAYKRRIVEITGIREQPNPFGGGNMKVAEFTWVYDMDDWPAVIKTCIPKMSNAKGRAMFALYDDGWRIEQVG
jgi:hypothetical protein